MNLLQERLCASKIQYLQCNYLLVFPIGSGLAILKVLQFVEADSTRSRKTMRSYLSRNCRDKYLLAFYYSRTPSSATPNGRTNSGMMLMERKTVVKK